MRERGVSDPDSQAGICVCLECPYRDCGVGIREERDTRLNNSIISMYKRGVQIAYIALELSISVRTVMRRLERIKDEHLVEDM